MLMVVVQVMAVIVKVLMAIRCPAVEAAVEQAQVTSSLTATELKDMDKIKQAIEQLEQVSRLVQFLLLGLFACLLVAAAVVLVVAYLRVLGIPVELVAVVIRRQVSAAVAPAAEGVTAVAADTAAVLALAVAAVSPVALVLDVIS